MINEFEKHNARPKLKSAHFDFFPPKATFQPALSSSTRLMRIDQSVDVELEAGFLCSSRLRDVKELL